MDDLPDLKDLPAKVYVCQDTGCDQTGDGTRANPFRTLKGAAKAAGWSGKQSRARKATDHKPAVTNLCRALGLPIPKPEHYFHPERRWRFDFAWPEQYLALEIEGATKYGGAAKLGRHQRADGMGKDCEKYAEALILGWKILRVTQDQLKNRQAGLWLAKLLAMTPK